MWHLIPAILYVAYAQPQAHHHRLSQSPYASPISNNDRGNAPHYYPVQTPAVQASPQSFKGPFYNYPQLRLSYIEEPAYTGPVNSPPLLQRPAQAQVYAYSIDGNHLRQPEPPSKGDPLLPEITPYDLDYNSNYLDVDVDTKAISEGPSYADDLDLVENFGYYLKKRTQLEGPTAVLNDAAHQYNALLAVLMSLARVIRNSCADFDQVYDQIYPSTVETYYKYGLANADKISVLIEDYIRKGNAHIPRIKKLKQELCEKDPYCSVVVDNKIKTSALLYVKELETLEALAHLARSYFPYIDEFNNAAQRGTVLPYLQNSKDRLREYVMHIVNSIEHLTDKPVRCT